MEQLSRVEYVRRYWGCVYNDERANTASPFGRCAGEMHSYVNPTILDLQRRRAVMWSCGRHAGVEFHDGKPLESW